MSADCTEARAALTPYVDGELDAGESGAFERHLEGCAVCRQALAAERALKSAIRAMPRTAMPVSLAERVRAALPPPRRPASTWFPRMPALAAGLALFLLGGVVARVALPPADGSAVGRDAASAHLRALVSERLTDVASSERHTVK